MMMYLSANLIHIEPNRFCAQHNGSRLFLLVTARNLNIALVADIDKRYHAGKQRKHQAQLHNLQIKPLSVL